MDDHQVEPTGSRSGFGGHVPLVDRLLSLRADLWARNSYDCDAGHFAGLGGSIAVCQFLLNQGAGEGQGAQVLANLVNA